MDGGWPTCSTDIIPFEQLSSVKFHSTLAECRFYKANLNTEGEQSVNLAVLTVENEASKAKFVQEAALLKLLNHRCIPQFLGICSVPDSQTRSGRSNGAFYPGFITKAEEGITLERYLQEAENKTGRRKPYPYKEILDVLIDIADALHYMHNRRPRIIHRGLSTATIRVISEHNKLSGQLATLRSVILSSERGTRVARLGSDTFRDDALVSEELLTMDFFKPTLVPTLTSFPTPSQRPQSPSMTDSETPTNRPRPTLAIPSSSRDKKSQNKTVSFNTEVTLLGQTSSTSSICSSQNNWSTPDPKNKTEVKRTNLPGSSESHGRHRQLGEVRVIRTSVSQYPYGSNTVQGSNAEMISPQKDCNNAPSATPPLSSVTVLEEDNSIKPVIQNSPSLSSEPVSDPSSNKPSPQHQREMRELRSTDLQVERSEITVDLDKNISEVVVSRPEDQDESISASGIYRKESMAFLRKQPGVNLAPEIVEGKIYDTSVDIFNFGIVIYRALTKMSPIVQSRNKGSVQLSFPDVFPNEVQELISNCCKRKIEARPNAKELGDQLRFIKESGCLDVLNKRWKSFLCFCGGTP
eukprot:g130.t1